MPIFSIGITSVLLKCNIVYSELSKYQNGQFLSQQHYNSSFHRIVIFPESRKKLKFD